MRPLANVNLQLFDEFENYFGEFQTDAEGKYYFSGLSNGSYRILINGVPEGYDVELYSEIFCADYSCSVAAGTAIEVADGDQPNHDIALDYTGTRIFGTVTRTDNGEPVSSDFGYMGVNLFDDAGNHIGGTGTDRAGNYQLHLPGGTASYFVVTSHDQGYHALLDECWDDVKCPDVWDPLKAGADLILVPDGTTVIADFVLDPAQVISGTVTESVGVTPIQGVQLDLWDQFGNYITSASTASDGSYKLPVPGPGEYYVFTPDYGVPAPYLPEVWNNAYCNISLGCDPVTTGNAVIVIGSANTAGIDFSLDEAASISGTVTSSVDGLPVAPQARLHALDGAQLIGVNGNPDGTYSLGGILPGTYYLLLNNRNGPLIDELFDDVKCPRFACDFAALGTQITVSVGEQLTGYDAALDPGSQISGTVTVDGAPPAEFTNLLIYDENGTYAGFAFTDASGNYQSRSGLPAGSYFVTFGEPSSESGYVGYCLAERGLWRTLRSDAWRSGCCKRSRPSGWHRL